MSFFKKLLGGTFESNRDEGEALFLEGRFGEARLAYERALARSKGVEQGQVLAVEQKALEFFAGLPVQLRRTPRRRFGPNSPQSALQISCFPPPDATSIDTDFVGNLNGLIPGLQQFNRTVSPSLQFLGFSRRSHLLAPPGPSIGH